MLCHPAWLPPPVAGAGWRCSALLSSRMAALRAALVACCLGVSIATFRQQVMNKELKTELAKNAVGWNKDQANGNAKIMEDRAKADRIKKAQSKGIVLICVILFCRFSVLLC